MADRSREEPTQADLEAEVAAGAVQVARGGTWLEGRYELREVIGRGGMSTVYRASDHVLQRDVAIKVFRATTGLDDMDERRRREVQLLSSLDDAGLIGVLDADVSDEAMRRGLPYLVTTLVDGPTLAERIRNSPLTERETAQVGAAISRTLTYIHGRGILHRDIKPANVLLPKGDLAKPKLVDFGIAVRVGGDRMTIDGTTVGSASYLSPEQVTGGSLTPASDIYSLGLVLIQALTGKVPFPGTGVESAMARLERDPAIPRMTSAALGELLREMTAREPQLRPDAAAAGARLREIADGNSSRPLRLALPAPPRHRRRGLMVALVAAILAGCAAVGAGLRLSGQEANGQPPIAASAAAAPVPTHQLPATQTRVPATGRRSHPALPADPAPVPPATPSPTPAANPSASPGRQVRPAQAKHDQPDSHKHGRHLGYHMDWGD